MPGELATKVVQQFCDEHPERYLLAFVYGYLGDHDLLAVRTDAEKFLLLAALNLVECVAFVGSATASREWTNAGPLGSSLRPHQIMHTPVEDNGAHRGYAVSATR